MSFSWFIAANEILTAEFRDEFSSSITVLQSGSLLPTGFFVSHPPSLAMETVVSQLVGISLLVEVLLLWGSQLEQGRITDAHSFGVEAVCDPLAFRYSTD